MGGNPVLAALAVKKVGQVIKDRETSPGVTEQNPYPGVAKYAAERNAADKAKKEAEDAASPSNPNNPDVVKAGEAQRRPAGRSATILNGGRGLDADPDQGARRMLLGR